MSWFGMTELRRGAPTPRVERRASSLTAKTSGLWPLLMMKGS